MKNSLHKLLVGVSGLLFLLEPYGQAAVLTTEEAIRELRREVDALRLEVQQLKQQSIVRLTNQQPLQPTVTTNRIASVNYVSDELFDVRALNHALVGKTPDQILEIVGKPDRVFTGGASGLECWEYSGVAADSVTGDLARFTIKYDGGAVAVFQNNGKWPTDRSQPERYQAYVKQWRKRNPTLLTRVEAEEEIKERLKKNGEFTNLSRDIETSESQLAREIEDFWRAGKVLNPDYPRSHAESKFAPQRKELDELIRRRSQLLRTAIEAEYPHLKQ